MSMNQNLIRAALTLVVSLAAVAPSSAQFFIMGNETVETCVGIFVDAGNTDDGTGNPYPDANFTYTICPDNPGDAVSVSFVAFGLQTNPNPNNSDYLFIYDGPDAGSPSMGNYTGNALQGLPVTATDPASPKVISWLRQTPMDRESGLGSGGSMMLLAEVGVAQGVVQEMLASHPGASSFPGPLSWNTNVRQPVGLFTVAVTGSPWRALPV